eukprot:gene39607-biopygen31572
MVVFENTSLRHDSDAFGVDSTKVGVLKKTYKISLCSFLECKDCRSLETKISLEVLSNFTNKTLEWKLADEKLS